MKILKQIANPSLELMADYILKNYGTMSHLKLQKLLYYCESYHLAYFETELFTENFQARSHGPVCTEIFHKYKTESLLYNDLYFDGKYNPDNN